MTGLMEEYLIEKGTVYLVGAGPGHAKLLTLRAQELICAADVILYDSLIGDEGSILGLARPEAEKIFVGKRPGAKAMDQEEIERRMIALAESDRSVVRLKGGDPMIFGRGGEEATALRAAEIPYEIVPGVTASLGAAAMASLPLTGRHLNSAVVLVTGHEDPNKDGPAVDWDALAKTGATLAIYMGMGHLAEIAEKLLAGGLSGDTPASVVEWATIGRQRSVFATLDTIAEEVQGEGLGSPAIIFIGAAAAEIEGAAWFESRAFFGRRFVLTRAREQNEELAARLRGLGAEVLELPLIEISYPKDPDTAEEVLEGLGTYDWVLFTSANGVRGFFQRFFELYDDIRSLGFLRLAVVGESTAAPLRALNLKPDLVPAQRDAEGLVTELLHEESMENRKVLVVTGNRNREEYLQRLESAGAIVDTFPVYETKLADLMNHPAATSFRELGADAIVFASPSAAESFLSQANNLAAEAEAKAPKTVSIGPTTSEAMRILGLPVDLEAAEPSVTGLVKALLGRWGK